MSIKVDRKQREPKPLRDGDIWKALILPLLRAGEVPDRRVGNGDSEKIKAPIPRVAVGDNGTK